MLYLDQTTILYTINNLLVRKVIFNLKSEIRVQLLVFQILIYCVAVCKQGTFPAMCNNSLRHNFYFIFIDSGEHQYSEIEPNGNEVVSGAKE